MGKKSNRKKKQKINLNDLPNVSICTPTFNRRPFFEGLLQCVKNQDYPHEKIEWIILDDGTDKVQDIFDCELTKEILGKITVRYIYSETRLDLGKKRNLLHESCTYKNDNDIIVYMDDDDYYPPQRVSHSVERLLQDPKALCGGSSELYLWFNSLDKMYKFGPYGPNHATAGTFAFKRRLLKNTAYQDDAVLAEEKHFLQNYTVPFVQFDAFKTILVVSHEQNTFDKKKLLNKSNKFVSDSCMQVKDFIKDDTLKQFYESKINDNLLDYKPGDVSNKPKVVEEIARREQVMYDVQKKEIMKRENKPSGVFATDNIHKKSRELTVGECKQIIIQRTDECTKLTKINKDLNIENCELRSKIICMEQQLDPLEHPQETP